MDDRTRLIAHLIWTTLSLLVFVNGQQDARLAEEADLILGLERQLEASRNFAHTLLKRMKTLEGRVRPLGSFPFGSVNRQRRRRRHHAKRGHLYGNEGIRLNSLDNQSPTDEVGFHTALTETTSFNSGETIVFDHVITNLGDSFSRETGTFTCPKTGTYLFNLSILCDKNSYIEAVIMQNDIPVFKALSYNRKDGTYSQGSGSAIVRMVAGDKAKVVMVKPSEETETLLGGFSHFSGYLLS